jgi:signal peptidase II
LSWRNARLWLIAAAVFVVDRASKLWIASHLPVGGSWPVIDNFLHISRSSNSGAAFGVGRQLTPLLALVSVVVIAALVSHIWRTRARPRPWLDAAALGLILGGATGNLVDRAGSGQVLDFIDFRGIWPYIFNFADASVVVGVALLALVWSRPRATERRSS